ncbi:MAG: hypothetical protein ACXAE3_08290 [Candidatus Kariarchaeaceae archaeon]|jgi:hypothetical protein
MLDSYELKQGSFEIVDSQMVEIRSKRILYYRLLRFLLVLLAVAAISLILIAIATSKAIWLVILLFPIFFTVFAISNMRRLSAELLPQISGILLDYDQNRQLTQFRVRRWLPNQMDTYSEEVIRHNQAVGFRVRWFDSGFLEVEIIVDREFPGTTIFQTFDFFVIAELHVFFARALPKHDLWHYVYEEGEEWDDDHREELKQEILTARVPWNIREYFTEL